ncbi:MAG: hypothetical protein KAJ55_00340 [Anaerolineales bacterium]|nr:hypothetical protein [Anaerolineales bacterium]
MRSALRKQRKVIRTPLLPGIGSVFTGETIHWGGEEKLIYREKVPVHLRSEVVPQLDGEGKPTWHYVHGQPTSMRTSRKATMDEGDPKMYREYIMDDLGNGKVSKNFHFRADPETLKRQEAKRIREQRKVDLMDALADSDLDPATLAQAVRDAKKARKPIEVADNAAEEPPEVEVVPDATEESKGSTEAAKAVQYSSGWWQVMRGDEVLKSKLRRAAADRMVESLNADGNDT